MPSLNRRTFVGGSLALAASGMGKQALAAPSDGAASHAPVSINDPRMPKVLTVEYQARDYEIVDYGFYTLPAMPRIRLRGPRFDPAAAAPGGFFTAFGSAHTLGVLSQTTYTDILASELGLHGWNVGVGGISASFYNYHPEIIARANRGKFAIVQVTAARMEGNDRFHALPAAQMVYDTSHGDVVPPETAWGRIAKEEPENQAGYVAQSRAAWKREYEKLLAALTVPTILFWFSARPMEQGGDATGQISSLSTTSFPQFVNGADVRQIKPLADQMALAVTARNAGNALISRFTGEQISIDVANLPEGRGPGIELLEDRNTYYPSPEMQEDAAAALLPVARKLV